MVGATRSALYGRSSRADTANVQCGTYLSRESAKSGTGWTSAGCSSAGAGRDAGRPRQVAADPGRKRPGRMPANDGEVRAPDSRRVMPRARRARLAGGPRAGKEGSMGELRGEGSLDQ